MLALCSVAGLSPGLFLVAVLLLLPIPGAARAPGCDVRRRCLLRVDIGACIDFDVVVVGDIVVVAPEAMDGLVCRHRLSWPIRLITAVVGQVALQIFVSGFV